MPVANDTARALRVRDPDALEMLALALQASDGSLKDAAVAIGLAGSSSLWRIAYDVPEVRQLIAAHGRRRGRRPTRATH